MPFRSYRDAVLPVVTIVTALVAASPDQTRARSYELRGRLGLLTADDPHRMVARLGWIRDNLGADRHARVLAALEAAHVDPTERRQDLAPALPWLAARLPPVSDPAFPDPNDLLGLFDWYEATRPDLVSLSLAQAVERAREWHAALPSSVSTIARPGAVVYSWDDGWTVQRLSTPAQLRDEGAAQGHCVGEAEYVRAVRHGRATIYSLRDASGVPQVTVEVDCRGRVVQAKGAGNRSPRYDEVRRVDQFLNSTRLAGEDAPALPLGGEVVRWLSEGRSMVSTPNVPGAVLWIRATGFTVAYGLKLRAADHGGRFWALLSPEGRPVAAWVLYASSGSTPQVVPIGMRQDVDLPLPVICEAYDAMLATGASPPPPGDGDWLARGEGWSAFLLSPGEVNDARRRAWWGGISAPHPLTTAVVEVRSPLGAPAALVTIERMPHRWSDRYYRSRMVAQPGWVSSHLPTTGTLSVEPYSNPPDPSWTVMADAVQSRVEGAVRSEVQAFRSGTSARSAPLPRRASVVTMVSEAQQAARSRGLGPEQVDAFLDAVRRVRAMIRKLGLPPSWACVVVSGSGSGSGANPGVGTVLCWANDRVTATRSTWQASEVKEGRRWPRLTGTLLAPTADVGRRLPITVGVQEVVSDVHESRNLGPEGRRIRETRIGVVRLFDFAWPDEVSPSAVDWRVLPAD